MARQRKSTAKGKLAGRSESADDKVVFTREFFAAAGRKSWKGLSRTQRKKRGARQTEYWRNMTAKERSEEMKRRAEIRKAKKKRGKSK